MTLILKNVPDENAIRFEFPGAAYREKIEKILESCRKTNNGYVSVTIEKPRKPRTAGAPGTQNNLIWRLITLIANETGDDSAGMSDTELGIKMRALSKGYPFKVSAISGAKIPFSMTKIDTVQCGYLIETAYEVCAELGIVLPENV